MITNFANNLIHLSTVDSTNEEAFRRAADTNSASFRLAVISDHQSAGKGRLGRSFVSEKNQGLYLSVLENEIAEAEITARVAVCVCKVLEDLCSVKFQIKWPNDIQINGKKICGILTEMRGKNVVIGIGINLYNEDFGDMNDIACSLKMLGINIDKTLLIKALLDALDNMLDNYAEAKLADLDFYRSHSSCINQDLYIIEKDKKIPVKGIAVDENFALIVELEDKSLKALSYGEISLRPRV